MEIREKNGIKYCVFKNIEETGLVSHAFSTRVGGVSKGVFDGLNVSYTRGDEKENVDENIKRICSVIDVQPENIVCGHQVHDKKVLRVTKEDIGKDISGYDAFITNEKGVVLSTFHADCVPVFLVDTKNKAVAMIHSGWRGTAKKICCETIEKMKEEFGTEPKDIAAAIGPSIGVCCFQVDEPVVKEFEKAADFANEFIFDDKNCADHYKIDLWGINKRLLESCGVTNIEVTNRCTMCSEELFYSHRRMGNERGSMAAYICLK